MRVLEKTIEKSVVAWARNNGIAVIKFNSFRGAMGYPDRWFGKNGKCCFIEFKAPGKDLTPLQRKRIEELQAQGFYCAVIRDVHAGQWVLCHALGIGGGRTVTDEFNAELALRNDRDRVTIKD